LSDGRIVIDLIDACRPGVIKYDLVKDAFTDEVANTFIVLFCGSVFYHISHFIVQYRLMYECFFCEVNFTVPMSIFLN